MERVALPLSDGVGHCKVSVGIHGKWCCKQSLDKLAAAKHIKLPLVLILLEEMWQPGVLFPW